MSKHKRKVRKLWFRAKEYGWGWFPISWQGYAITALYALLFTLTFILFSSWIGAAAEAEVGLRDVAFGVVELIAALAILSYTLYKICMKWGEKPGWHWGKK